MNKTFKRALWIFVLVGLFLQGGEILDYLRGRLVDASPVTVMARLETRLSHEDRKTHRVTHALKYGFEDAQGRKFEEIFPVTAAQLAMLPPGQSIEVVYLSWWPSANLPRLYHRTQAPWSDLNYSFMVLEGWAILLVLGLATGKALGWIWRRLVRQHD